MLKTISNKILIASVIIIFGLNSCAKQGFFKPGDARKSSPDPRERVKKNNMIGIDNLFTLGLIIYELLN